MITFDTFIRWFSAFGLVVLGLLTLWFVLSTIRRQVWYRCPRCCRWQNEAGRYGLPPTRDAIGGDNLCSHCEREYDNE